MFNRKIELRIVKDNKPADNAGASVTVAPTDFKAIAEECAKRLVIGSVIVIAASVVLTTASTILVNALNNTESE